MLLVIIILVLLFFIILNKLYRIKNDKFANGLPPGLPWLPVTGSYWFLLWGNYQYPYRTVGYYAKKYKSKIVSLQLGQYFTVVATSYESIKEMLNKKEFDGRLTETFLAKSRAFGKTLGIFFMDGPNWKEQRRFALRHMRDFGFGRRMDKIENDFAEELTVLIDTLRNGPINDEEKMILKENRARFPDILHPVAANFFLAFFSGERVPRNEHEKLREVAQAGTMFQRHNDPTGGAILFAPWLRHFAHGFSFPGFAKSTKRITEFIRKCVSSNEASYIEDADRGFVDTYIKKLEETDKSLTFSKDQLLLLGTDFIFPSITANPWMVTIIIKYMMHYPEIMKKVQGEIDAVVGRDHLVTLSDRVNLPYTEATIREIMRHHTMVPWSVTHRAMEDGELSGYKIPANTVMITDLEAMHHDPDFWGDPDNVRPERFLTEDGRLGKDPSLPFGAGGRLCAGETFARQFLFLTFSNLVQNFNFSFIDGEPSGLEDILPGLIVGPKDLWVGFTPRE